MGHKEQMTGGPTAGATIQLCSEADDDLVAGLTTDPCANEGEEKKRMTTR